VTQHGGKLAAGLLADKVKACSRLTSRHKPRVTLKDAVAAALIVAGGDFHGIDRTKIGCQIWALPSPSRCLACKYMKPRVFFIAGLAFALMIATGFGAEVVFTVPNDFRVFNGELVNTKNDPAWCEISVLGIGNFEFQFYKTNVAIAKGYKFRRAAYKSATDSRARVGGFIGGAGGGASLGGSYETKDKIYVEPIAIFNNTKKFLTGQDVAGIRVRRNGDFTLDGQVLAAYDCGTLPTKEQFEEFVRAVKEKRADIE
jgi:hypothetical protein